MLSIEDIVPIDNVKDIYKFRVFIFAGPKVLAHIPMASLTCAQEARLQALENNMNILKTTLYERGILKAPICMHEND